MKKSSLSGYIMLLITAVIWGSAFVAQSTAMDSIGPLTFNCLRNVLGGTFLLPITIIIDKKRQKIYTDKPDKNKIKKTVLIGLLCGVVLCTASLLQQYGIALGTNAGKAGFITSLYILFVPIIGLFLKKKTTWNLWISVAISIAGLYLLCSPGHDGFEFNDILILACAVVFACHIVIVDNLAVNLNGVKISCIQFYTSAVISAIGMFIFEKPDLVSIKAAFFSIAYAGIMSSGIAYTLQIIGQQRTEPTIASILMSLESTFAVITTIVFSAFSGNLILPTVLEWVGMGLMFVAIMLAQINFKGLKKVKQ